MTAWIGPDFVLYDSGLVIFKRDSRPFPPQYLAVALSHREKDDLIASLSITDEFLGLASRYDLTNATDQVTNVIFLWQPVERSVTIYGRIPKLERPHADDAPTPFVALYNQLDTFDHPRAREWIPETLEVRVYPLKKEFWVQDPIPWPVGWPGLDDPTVERMRYGSFRFSVKKSELETLRRMSPKVGKEPPVEIGEAQFRIQYTLRVPTEHVIWKAIKTVFPY